MENQKNIDRLFQEKLEHFEQSPRPEVWAQIQSRMNHKKKRKFPFWFLYGGAAAILVVSLLLFLPRDTSNTKINPDSVVTSPSKNKTKTIDTLKKKELKKPFFKKEIQQTENSLLTEKTHKNNLQKVKKGTSKDYTNTTPKSQIAKVIDPKKDLNKKENSSTVQTTKEKKKEQLGQPKKGKEKKSDSKPTVDFPKKKDSLLKKPFDKKKKDFFANIDDDILQKEEENNAKWSIRPLIAFSKTPGASVSPTDKVFSNNPTSGNSSFNYGISVAYQLTEKLILQSGILTQNISFNTQEIALFEGTSISNTFSSIDLNTNLPYFLSGLTSSVAINDLGTSALITDRSAELNQIIGYVEVPLEAKYRIYNSRKISSSIIGGFSSLFLNRNEIVLLSTVNGETSIGKATNLNTVNFSGNIGLDFDYNLGKNLFLNINPMVKVHLNTFSRDGNGFQPFFLGVYSGVKYQF